MVGLVFDLFDELGLINGVLRFLVDHDIQIGIRAREGPEKGLLVWRRPSRIVIQNMLRHPACAGIYVYGRSRTDPRRGVPGRPCTGRVRKPREDWFVYLPGVLPAYIDRPINGPRPHPAPALWGGDVVSESHMTCFRCASDGGARCRRAWGGGDESCGAVSKTAPHPGLLW
ncbi:recombinase family protein [Streptomyces aurantiacus]|uniref:recombinase family protein n=1 Tax=Streptomyces aurantiacus TaxID=47760 RepID=UPI001BD367DE